MATWGELDHLFDLPKHENPTPWKHIESMKSVDDHFTDIFAQLYLKENLDQEQEQEPESSSPSLFTLSPSSSISSQDDKKLHRRSDSASSFNSERSSVCNGFESSDDVEDSVKDDEEEICAINSHRHHARTESFVKRSMRSNSNYGAFPPPISCIGRSGKPWVSFQSIRQNGRFILTEVRIPTQEFMHACRENGRLKLHFIHSESEEEEEEEEEMAEIGEAMEA